MIDRRSIIAAVAAELDARAGRSFEEHAELGARVADRLGLADEEPPPARGRVWIFGRRVKWLPVPTATRFHGVILATRSASAAKPNRARAWIEALRGAEGELAGWEWMLPPGQWRAGLAPHVRWLASVGARALVLNVEPASGAKKGTAEDWRGKHEELRAYVTSARELCERHDLELWVTSWALPSSAPSFPWAELVAAAHRAIPQPYEVHGSGGEAYVERVIREWTERGARDLIIGRGAHELDKSDDDAWRTSPEIARHRRSTPAGYDEAWWLAAGKPPSDVVDAILAP